MTVTILNQTKRDDRYMEQKKIDFDNPSSNPTQQIQLNSSSSAQQTSSAVSQTPQSKKLSVNFLLNSPEEKDDASPLQQVTEPTSTPQTERMTFLPSTKSSNLHSINFQIHHEPFQNTPSQPPLSPNEMNSKRIYEDDIHSSSKRSRSENDLYAKHNTVFTSSPFPTPITQVSLLQHPQASYDPSMLYYHTLSQPPPVNPAFDLSNLQSKSLPLTSNNNSTLQELILAATSIEATGASLSSSVADAVVVSEQPSPQYPPQSSSSSRTRATRYSPAPKNTPGPPNGAYFDEQWMMRYHQLKKFKNQYGHTNVTRTKQEWRSLGNWVCEQRRKVRAGKLTEQQFQLLDDLGFEWDRSYYFRPGAADGPEVDTDLSELSLTQSSNANNNNNSQNNNNSHRDSNVPPSSNGN